MSCILCLKKKSKQIKICSKKGQEFNCSHIISKHFWIQPSTQKNSKESVCLVCWNIVSDFHKFYQSVAEAHNYLETENVNLNTSAQEFLNVDVPKPKKESVDLPKDLLFDAEVKLEINDLEYLPGTEVIENVYDTNDCFEKDIKTNPLEKDDSDIKENSNKTQIKQEPVFHSGDDSESEVPLSIFLQSDLKIDDKPLELSVKTNESPKNVISSSDNDSSIHESVDSESDGLNNAEETEKFAEITTKRRSAKSKTNGNGKRTKPTSSKRRVKDWDTIRLEQQKYDEIIAKLFDKFPCRICKLFVRNFGDMRRHFKMAHKGRQPSVECCERKYDKRLTLADHVLVHLNPEHFKCSKCGQILKDSITLKEHEESHDLPPDQLNEKKGFSCHICSQKLASKHGVEKHILSKHVPKSEYKIPCGECSKMFPTKHVLKKHVRETHRGSRSVICDQCGKTLQTKYILKKHIEREHLKLPPPEPVRVQCTICKIWLRDLSIKNHMKCVHDQTKGEHRCHICGYLSVNARSLERHVTYNHKLEQKFQCPMCDKAFRRPNELKRHNLMHAGETVNCDMCPMTFGSRASYYIHRQKVHGYQPKPGRRVGLNKKENTIATKIKIESEELNPHDFLASEEADTENMLVSKESKLENAF